MHTFALGGVHGGIKNYICRPEDGKKIIWVDVGSMYPNILTKWDLLSRQVDRNGLKKWLKTNKIAEEWRRFQIEKYGLGVYQDMQRANRKRR